MDDYDLPFWLQIPVQDYRRWLNRQAVALAKADRKRGGSYRVREAMQSIHRACHACDGHDPYDGLPLRGGCCCHQPSRINISVVLPWVTVSPVRWLI